MAAANITMPQPGAIHYPTVLIRLSPVHDGGEGICWKLRVFLALLSEFQAKAVRKLHRPPTIALPEEQDCQESQSASGGCVCVGFYFAPV
jgi:hypothetical protein